MKRNFLFLWGGQSLSWLGSAMTRFALMIWAYQKQGTVLSIALLSVFSYLPSAVISIFAGPVIDRHNKKRIMLLCDSIAVLCTLCSFIAIYYDALQVWHLYFLNAISGASGAFQYPASKVLTALIVPKEQYARTNGLRSLSDAVISVFHPVFAATVVSLAGLRAVLAIDLATFVVGFFSLAFFVTSPESKKRVCEKEENSGYKQGLVEGIAFLNEHIGFFYLMLFMAGVNFLASLAFYSVLPAMVLSRTAGNQQILGWVNGSIGAGSIVGSLIVSTVRLPSNRIKTMFYSSALAFLLCDIFLGVGRHPVIWVMAGFVGNLPIPFLTTAESVLLQTKIPEKLLGRVLSIRSSMQFITMPLGYLMGGLLADRCFEPLMAGTSSIQTLLANLVGEGKGSGMALIFVFTGVSGFVGSVLSYRIKHIRALDGEGDV